MVKTSAARHGLITRCTAPPSLWVARISQWEPLRRAGYDLRTPQDEIAALRAEIADLKTSVLAFGGPFAVEYAKMQGLPDGSLRAHHFDILKAAGGRMDSFTRYEDKP